MGWPACPDKLATRPWWDGKAKNPPRLLADRCPKFGSELGDHFCSLLFPSRCSTPPPPPGPILKSPSGSLPHRRLGDFGANSRMDSRGPGQLCTGRVPSGALGVGPGVLSGLGRRTFPGVCAWSRGGTPGQLRRGLSPGHPPTGGCTPPPPAES